MICSTCWITLLLLCPIIQGQYNYDYGQRGQSQETFAVDYDVSEPCATKDSVGKLQSSVSSLSTSITTQFNQVNEAVRTRCDTKTVIKTILSAMQSSKRKYTDELKALLAEVVTKTDLQTLHSKQVEMALAQVATDDLLANSTMMLQMELQMIKYQMANKENLQLVKEAVDSSTSALKHELDLVKTELTELKKTCLGCHTSDKNVCVYKNESYYMGSFNLGCEERCECFANSTMICKDRCNPPFFSVGSLSHDPLCTEIPSTTDRCCVNVSCITAGSSSKIPLNESNIIDHCGFRPGGAGPENLLHDNGFWNPNPPPWYVIFDFHRRFTVGSVELSNFGDVTHDVAQFTLETSDNITLSDNYKLVTKATSIEKGINDPQLFTFTPATGRYWRFKIIKTYSEFQPWVEELIFHGHPAKEYPIEITGLEKPVNITNSGSGATQLPETNNIHEGVQQVQHQLGQKDNEEKENKEQHEGSSTWRNCDDVHEHMLLHVRDPPSMISLIFPYEEDENKTARVFCNGKIDGGGWTLIQHRGDYNHYPSGRLDFNKLWNDYKEGFGDPEEDHWLGLDAISALSNQGPTELLILLGDFNGEQRYAHYDHFVVHNETTGYTLQVSGYSGNAGDSFSFHSGQKFTTLDVDNDRASNNCAYQFGGPWWHKDCHESNLNGRYLSGAHVSYADGIEWKAWHGYYYSLNTTTMMIRLRRDNEDDMQQGVVNFPGPVV